MGDPGPERMVVCRAGDERFSVPVTLVREVVALPPLTRIPGAPPSVHGLANVHGLLVTVLGGSLLAGLPVGPAGPWLVVLTLRRGQVGIAVDEVEDLSVSGTAARPVDAESLVKRVMGG